MLKYFASENLKARHTFAEKFVFIAPIALILLSVLVMADYFQVDIYNWWYTSILPGMTAVCCCLFARIDGRRKNKSVLSLPLDLKKVWMAKIMAAIKGIVLSSIIILAAGQLSVYIIPINSVSHITFISSLAAIFIIILTTMWQVPLYLFIGGKAGMFLTVLFSMAANVSGIVMAPSIIWEFNPFSYTSRLMCPVLKILPNGLLALPESQTFSNDIMNLSSIPFGIAVSLILFIALSYITAKWYSNVEAD